MNPLILTLLAIDTGCLAALCASCLPGKITAWLEVLAGLCMMAAGLWVFHIDETFILPFPGFLSNAKLAIDPLSAVFLMPLGFVTATSAIYAICDWSDAEHPQNNRLVRGMHAFMASSMAFITIGQTGVIFLMSWAFMSIAGFFLVAADHLNPKSRQAALIELATTHLSVLFLWALFAFIEKETDWFGFTTISSTYATTVLTLGLLGFGLKAGFFPFHMGLPGSHAFAPNHASALFSGALSKLGIYGIARLLLICPPHAEFAFTLVILGVVSAFCGALFALGQQNHKRLLAWHSVSQMGIILLGLGIGTLGRIHHQPSIALLGYAGALLHVWNHALFKGLLFYSAGSIMRACHTCDLDKLGGLGKKMPKTLFWSIIGSAALCGLPPLNGFVSLLWICLALFESVQHQEMVGMAFAAPLLAMTVALTIASMVKAIGALFLGEPRSDATREAQDPPRLMRWVMVLHGGVCIGIGVYPRMVLPLLETAVSKLCPEIGDLSLQSEFQGVGTTYLTGALLILMGCFYLLNRHKCMRAARQITWSTGLAVNPPRAQWTAASLTQGLVQIFSPLLRPKTSKPRLRALFPEPAQYETYVGDVVFEGLLMPFLRKCAQKIGRLRTLQSGQIQLYFLYMGILVLGLLAWLWFGSQGGEAL